MSLGRGFMGRALLIKADLISSDIYRMCNEVPSEYYQGKEILAKAKEKGQSILDVIKTKPIMNYVGIWLMFYLNITCGLALISQEKMIVKCLGLAGSVATISIFSAVFNAGGRLVLSAAADRRKR